MEQIEAAKKVRKKKEAAALPSKKLVGVPWVAARIGESAKGVYNLVYSRKIPHYRIAGKALRFDSEEIETWLQQSHVLYNTTAQTSRCHRKGGRR